jgi:hypothetical protein
MRRSIDAFDFEMSLLQRLNHVRGLRRSQIQSEYAIVCNGLKSIVCAVEYLALSFSLPFLFQLLSILQTSPYHCNNWTREFLLTQH